jgi:hypothetical protein
MQPIQKKGIKGPPPAAGGPARFQGPLIACPTEKRGKYPVKRLKNSILVVFEYAMI